MLYYKLSYRAYLVSRSTFIMRDGSDPDSAAVTAKKAVHCSGLVIASLLYEYGKGKYSSKKKENLEIPGFDSWGFGLT